MHYLVVLFKNKKRKKIIKSFVRKNKAEYYYKKCLDENSNIFFGVEYENAKRVDYEIALLSKNDESQMLLFKQDDLGRNVKIELSDSDFKIINLQKYKIEETIYDWATKKKITFKQLLQKYFGGKELKSVFTLNNKLIVQVEDNFSIFSLKNANESLRLLTTIENYYMINNKGDSIFLRDIDTTHRKYLYSLLEKSGVDRKKLYRQSTTFSHRK